MMLLCVFCEKQIKHDEDIYVFVRTKFKALKSLVHWAVGDILWADKESIAHTECYEVEQRINNEI